MFTLTGWILISSGVASAACDRGRDPIARFLLPIVFSPLNAGLLPLLSKDLTKEAMEAAELVFPSFARAGTLPARASNRAFVAISGTLVVIFFCYMIVPLMVQL
jgi:hypothetical protein